MNQTSEKHIEKPLFLRAFLFLAKKRDYLNSDRRTAKKPVPAIAKLPRPALGYPRKPQGAYWPRKEALMLFPLKTSPALRQSACAWRILALRLLSFFCHQCQQARFLKLPPSHRFYVFLLYSSARPPPEFVYATFWERDGTGVEKTR